MPVIADDSIILRFIRKGEKDFQKGLKDSKREVTGLRKSFGSLNDFIKGTLISEGILSLTRGLADLGRNMIDAAVKAEQTQVSFETFLGGAEAARKTIEELNKFSLETPFTPDQVIDAGKALLAFGVEVDKLEPSLARIGDISAGTGKDFNELAIIFGKAKVAGTLFAEDINQLTEAGVPVIQEFAKQLGVTEGEVKKLASQGKLSFANLEEAFISLTSEGGKFFELTINQSKTVGGLFSTLEGAGQAALKSLGEAFLPILREILPPLINLTFKFVEAIKPIGESVGGNLVRVFTFLRGAVEPLIPVFNRTIEIFGEIRMAISEIIPTGNIFAGLFNTAANTLEFFGKVFNRVFGNSVIQTIIKGVVRSFLTIPAIFNGIVAALTVMGENFIISFDSIKLRAQLFAADLAGIFNPAQAALAESLRAQIKAIDEQKKSVGEAFNEALKQTFSTPLPPPKVDNDEVKKSFTRTGEEAGKSYAKALSKEQKKAQEQFVKDVLEAEKALKQLRIDAIQDDAERARATIELERANRLEALVGTPEQIKEASDLINAELDSAISGLDSRDFSLGSILRPAGAVLDSNLKSELDNDLKELTDYAANILSNTNGIAVGEGGAGEQSFFEKLFGDLLPDDLEAIKEQAQEVVNVALDLTKQLNQQQIDRVDNEIEEQQRKVEEVRKVADEGNAEQLQAEEERLNDLLQKREAAVQRQRVIAAAETAINQGVAISEAIKAAIKAFSTNPLLGVLQIAAAGAAIVGLVSTLNNTFAEDVPTFHDGTTRVMGIGKSDNGLRPDETYAKLQQDEMILDAKTGNLLRSLGYNHTDIAGLALASVPRLAKSSSTTIDNTKELEAIGGQLVSLNKKVGNLQTNVRIDETGISIIQQRYLKRMKRKRK